MKINPKDVFLHYLKQLQHLLTVIESHQQGGLDIFASSLQADMLPFAQQVRTTANFALRACCPLANLPVLSFDNDQLNWQGLGLQISQTIAHIQQIDDAAFNSQNASLLSEKAGFSDVLLPADEFLSLYTLPNFFFHLSMVYAIARQQGVPVSKGDFDGIHDYPVGFSFVSE
ncbi:DUF1993 family protein [Alteromonadaceae bacterium BrNp21-10]|nr:DUF1993 family protein [Alteromonadaceae bacterium BrNp21-10]